MHKLQVLSTTGVVKRNLANKLPLIAGIHGSFTQQYLPPTDTGANCEYDIRNGIGTKSTPKYS